MRCCIDWKSTIIMIDTSIQDSSHEVVTCHLFMPEDEMPRVSAGDVLVLYRVKVPSHFPRESVLETDIDLLL